VMELTARILSVTPKLVKNGTMTIWLVNTPEGEFGTTQSAIGHAAEGLLNQMADLDVTVRQNGEFENKYLNKITVSKQGLETPAAVQAARAQEAQQRNATTDMTFEQYRAGVDEKEQKINRAVALKAAVRISETPEELAANLVAFMEWLEHGRPPRVFGFPPEPDDADDVPF
jgi:predicted ATP-dependent protease